MAHFAELDADNIVVRVLVVPNEQENRGHEYLATDLGLGGTWVQTSYNATIRKNYAGIGYSFDSVRDAFIPPKPYASWVLNEDTCNWDAPVARPEDDKMYSWDEATTSWVEVEVPA
jgi:hypothetical protein